jgi:predicted DNA-binding transcriptional regulator
MHVIMGETNEIEINSMIDHLEKTMLQASSLNDIRSLLYCLLVTSKETLKVHDWLRELLMSTN